MTPAHLKTTMAALAAAATPPHLQAAPGVTMSAGSKPAAAAAAAGGAHTSAEVLVWDDIVAGLNSTLPSTQVEEGTR